MAFSDRTLELKREADSARDAARYYEAALFYEQAYLLAQQYGLRKEAQEYGFWAAESWQQLGKPLRALELLIEIRRDVSYDLSPLDFDVRGKLVDLYLCFNPSHEKIERILGDLERVVRTNRIFSRSDVHYARARLLMFQGYLEESLEQIELAWLHKDDLGQSTYQRRYQFADCAVKVSLHLRRRSAAERWSDVLGNTDTHLPTSRVAWYASKIALALWDQRITDAENLLDLLDEEVLNIQVPCYQQRVAMLHARVALARGLAHRQDRNKQWKFLHLGMRIKATSEVQMKYERLLLLADYRLACVRDVAGMGAVEDLWYTKSQERSTRPPTNLLLFEKCVNRAYHAFLLLKRYARHLDVCFGGRGFGQEVQQHAARLEEIMASPP